MFINKETNFFIFVIAFFLGMLAFLLVFGCNVVNPFDDSFIFSFPSDISQYQTGWSFFKKESWHFPLGLHSNLTYPDSISVFWTDSIPLLAIFFKIFSKILPDNFQYLGLFEMFNFGLQAFFASVLLSKYISKNMYGVLSLFIASLFLTITPYMIKFSFTHSPSTAHWLILASLLPFVYSEKFSLTKIFYFYFLVSFFASLINVYLFVFCFLISFFYVLYCIFQYKNIKYFYSLLIYLITGIANYGLMGIFYSDFDCLHQNFVESSFNINGFINSVSLHSFFLPELPLFDMAQLNCISYLGIGILCLLIFALFLFLYNIFRFKKVCFNIKHVLVVLLFLTALVISLSPRITMGDIIIFEYQPLGCMESVWNLFRVTGRFIFISYYILVLSLFAYIFRKLPNIITFGLFLSTFIFQMCEFYPSIHENYQKINNVYSIKENQIIKTFDLIQNKIDIVYLQPLININNENLMSFKIHPIAYWANARNVKLSDYYLSRNLKNRLKKFENAILSPKATELFIYAPYSSEDMFALLFRSPIENIYYIPKAEIYIASLSPIFQFENYKITKKLLLSEMSGYEYK